MLTSKINRIVSFVQILLWGASAPLASGIFHTRVVAALVGRHRQLKRQFSVVKNFREENSIYDPAKFMEPYGSVKPRIKWHFRKEKKTIWYLSQRHKHNKFVSCYAWVADAHCHQFEYIICVSKTPDDTRNQLPSVINSFLENDCFSLYSKWYFMRGNRQQTTRTFRSPHIKRFTIHDAFAVGCEIKLGTPRKK